MSNRSPTPNSLGTLSAGCAGVGVAKKNLAGVVNSRKEADNLLLKEKSVGQLRDMLLEGAIGWEAGDRLRLTEAIDLAQSLHEGDFHKDKPYVYHLLRVANRIRYYLGRNDSDLVVSAILHDSVEDHSDELVKSYRRRLNMGSTISTLSAVEKQQFALRELEHRFGARSAEIVAAVTNPPKEVRKAKNQSSLDSYSAKVQEAVSTADGWFVKFCDWADNGLGIIHGDDGALRRDGNTWGRREHFMRKYGLVLPTLELRFEQPDIQSILSSSAKRYIRQQFALGRERLRVPAT